MKNLLLSKQNFHYFRCMAKFLFHYFIRIFLFWLALFFVQRIVFSIEYWDLMKDASFYDWLYTFIAGIRLDLATAGAVSTIPFIFYFIYLAFRRIYLKNIHHSAFWIMVICVIFIHTGEVNAYLEWHHKLTSRVFTHLSNPDEVFRSADGSMTLWFVIYSIVEFVASFFLFIKLILPVFSPDHVSSGKKRFVFAFPAFLLTLGFHFLFIRGGIQPIPLNINTAYFSNSTTINDLATNSTYFFADSYKSWRRTKIDHLIPKVNPDEAKKIVYLLMKMDSTFRDTLLSTPQPNVIFIIMESWSANAIESAGGEKGATPNFDNLVKQGYLFDQLYSAAHTSEIGNSSIFSGFPSIPEVSVTKQPDKHRKLRCLNQDFESLGYHSGYLFSGDLKYGNIGGYFLDHGFQDVQDEDDMPKNIKRGKLNFYDDDLYDYLIKKINKNPKPFFQCAFTGSTHSPFDQPKSKGQDFKGNEDKFMNSLVYADQALGRFIDKCKQQSWYKNTLFVFVADHGHHTPTGQDMSYTSFYRIPFLLYGEPLKNNKRGIVNHTIGSQSDIAATLVKQFGLSTSNYPWSRDLLDPKRNQFALHCIIRGYGWKNVRGNYTRQMEGLRDIENSFLLNSQAKEKDTCNALLYSIYQYYKAL
jgi:phosphoglycerol transferase MdoB-like AlkP superfamily enzyme